jgi:hemerythrin
MALLWQKTMSVGNDAIDHDHRYLISFINTIELVLQSPEDKKSIMDALDQLYEYGEEHFQREETIQRKIKYPKSLNHKHIHSKLLDQLKVVKEKIKGLDSAGEISKYAPELTTYLRGWLINRVFNEDMLLKPYLLKHPKGLY